MEHVLRSANNGTLREYTVILETGSTNVGAWVPDLPGCVSVGKTPEEAEANMREAISFHLQGMREDGEPVPEPVAPTVQVKLA